MFLPSFILTFLVTTAVGAPRALNQARQNVPSATIDSGVVVGVQTSVSNSPNLVDKFLGLPFAASPTRFSPAQTATPWSQPYMATRNGPACIQVGCG